MSFYVTLPCLVGLVGLVEMSYPQNWIYKKDGFITFKIDKKIDKKIDTF